MTSQSSSHGASQVLCLHLARGLHAAAQPLTILMASLCKGHTDGLNVDELRALTARSAIEVQRVCGLFSGLQELVIAENSTPELSATPIVSLLAEVVDGVRQMFENDGMSLCSSVNDACTPVLIDRARTYQALSSVLLVCHSLARAQDRIELVASPSCRGIEIEVRNPRSSREACHPEANLGMALAEANIRSQRGEFWWGLQPFTVRIELLSL
jgi:hypothetical protein